MISEAKSEVLRLFADGLELYRRQDFSEARHCFEKALELDPNDGPSRTFFTRCLEYMEDPPGEGWDGVYEMKTK